MRLNAHPGDPDALAPARIREDALKTFRERAGVIAGHALSPLVALGSAARRSRFLHPEGLVLAGRVRPDTEHPELRPIAQRLQGAALVRLSGAWWKKHQWPDVLGCAVRFRASTPASVEPMPEDQDLLFATIRKPWTTLLAPLTTHVDDFLRNDYYGVSPFRANDSTTMWLRVVPNRVASQGATREEKLWSALRREPIVLRLEAAARRARYRSLAVIELDEKVAIDQHALRFDPFRNGRGITPLGFVHHLRIATYACGQAVRARAGV